MQFDELVSEVRQAAGIDVDDAETRIGRWVNLAVRELVTKAKWLKAEVELTDDGNGRFAVPTNVFEVEDLRLGDRNYHRVGSSELQNAKAGLISVYGGGGVFSPQFDTSAGRFIELFPAPTEGTVTVLAAVYPPTFTGAEDVGLWVPEEHHLAIVHKAIAVGLSFAEENNEAAEYHEGKFREGIEALRRHANAQVSSTTQQGLIAGIHY